jgi:SDR family mycofactocin-dependent oxidoreductase
VASVSRVSGGDVEVAVVTGAARGIGAATVRRLAADGWAVVAVDACADDPAVPYALATRAELDTVVAGAGPNTIGVVADVRSGEGMRAAVAEATDRFGGLDAAVAAAGVLRGGPPAWEMPEEAWAVQLDVNLTGVWRLAVAAVPALLARPEPRRGRFVAISSVAGFRALPQLAGYAASKHGVIGLTSSLAAELGPHGVTANVVCPGSTATPMLDASAAVYDLTGTDEFARYHVLGRLLEPGEVAAAVAFLCGPEAGGITGAVVPVDAGMSAT